MQASSSKTLIMLTTLSFIISDSSQLHISKSQQRRKNMKKHCEEVLWGDLVCPSVGSFPIAGRCDYFARCYQTEAGIEPETDFCPDGQIYLVNKCVKSGHSNDCPQINCAPTSSSTTMIPISTASTTTSTNFTSNSNTFRPFTTNRPLLNLHPSRNSVISITNTNVYLIHLQLFWLQLTNHLV